MPKAVHDRKAAGIEDLPRLSCKACRERKIKCDKLTPCSNCQRSDVICEAVNRKRLPRGRHVRQERTGSLDLRARVQQLEALVQRLDPNVLLPVQQSETPRLISPANQPEATKSPSEQYIAGPFWQDLVEQVHGLLDVIDEPISDDQGVEMAETHTSGQKRFSKSLLISLGDLPDVHTEQGNPLDHLSDHSAILCKVYRQNVDPLVKILHYPSLESFLVQKTWYLSYPERHPVPEALRFAVYFLAVCTLDEETTRLQLQVSNQKDLVAELQLACRQTLENANLLVTRDITVLQAFVLYLLGCRSQGQNRAVWTLVPVAIRIAHGLGLHVDEQSHAATFFDQQMRSRLWYAICLLDTHSSFDRGSEPLVHPGSSHPAMPRNLRDDQLYPGQDQELPENESFNPEISLALMLWNVQSVGRELNGKMLSESASNAQRAETIQQSLDKLQQAIKKVVRGCDPSNGVVDHFAFYGSRNIMFTAQLLSLRPINRRKISDPSFAQSSSNILQMALRILQTELVMRSDPHSHRLNWFGLVQWHPIAVAIAESYACEDLELLRQAWPLIETVFDQNAKRIADCRNGMVWKPIERLMKKTRERVHQVLGASSSPLEARTGLSSLATQLPWASESLIEAEYRSADPPPVAIAGEPLDMWMPSLPSPSLSGDIPQVELDPAWGTWEDFMNEVFFEDTPLAEIN
jgi:hypothetical protein